MMPGKKRLNKKETKNKKSGVAGPHKSIEFDLLLLDVMWPLQNYFETLLRSKKSEDRDFAAVGTSLFRDAFEKWETISDAVKKSLGNLSINLLGEEIPEDIYTFPRYLGATIMPKAKAETEEPQPAGKQS